MKILAIDTTTKIASCTILNDGKYFTKSIANEITHSEKLLPIIDKTFTKTNLKLNDIDMYAVINGPGSFTGLRIGLATLKAFAQVNDKATFSISSLDLIGYTAFKSENVNEAYVLSIIDARNSRVYYSISKMTKKDNKIKIEEIYSVTNDILSDAIEKIKSVITDKNIIIAGTILDDFKAEISEISESIKDLYPSTEDLIDAYMNLSNIEDYMYNAYTLDALYARPSQAERVSGK